MKNKYQSLTKEERFKGSLVGLATGDALGASLEFIHTIPNPPLTEMTDGYWTDDTSMALCTVHSLIDRRTFDLRNQMENFVSWYTRGFLSSRGYCFDIGNRTREALEDYMLLDQITEGVDPHDDNLSNGSLMRLAPVPLFYYNNVELAAKRSKQHTLLTHPSQMCVDASACLSTFITCCFHDHLGKHALVEDVANYRNDLFPSLSNWFDDYLLNPRKPDTSKHVGYVMTSLEMALWAFLTTPNFEEGCILCVNNGGDTDTYAAIYGQLAGAYYGYKSIPERWTKKLIQHKIICDYAKILCDITA